MAVSLESRGNRMKKAFFLGSLLVIGIFSALAVRSCESAMNGQQIAQLITAQKRKVKIAEPLMALSGN